MITYTKDKTISPLTVKALYEKLRALIADLDTNIGIEEAYIVLEIDVRRYYDESCYSGVWRGMTLEVTAEFPSQDTGEPILKKVLGIETDEDTVITIGQDDMSKMSLTILITKLQRLIDEGKGDLICHGLIYGRDGSVNCDIQNVTLSLDVTGEHLIYALLRAERSER